MGLMLGDGEVVRHCIVTEEGLSEVSAEAVPRARSAHTTTVVAASVGVRSAAGHMVEDFPEAAPMAVAVDIAEATRS